MFWSVIAAKLQAIVASKMTLVLAGLASAVITLALFSDAKTERTLDNPASNAEAVYGNLMSQIKGTSPSSAAAARWEQTAPEGLRTHGPAIKLTRDLFAPPNRVLHARSIRTAPVFVPVIPKPPRLTGILIDGASRKAMVDGILVSQGDIVSGYMVTEIARGWVVLEKDGVSCTLQVGEGQ
jgi:hypothetical protein